MIRGVSLPPLIRAPTIEELASLSELCFRSKAVWGYNEEFLKACRSEHADRFGGQFYCLAQGRFPYRAFFICSVSHDDHELSCPRRWQGHRLCERPDSGR